MYTCAREGCDNEFVKRTHNMKYCSAECCQQATNERLMVRYYEQKARRSGQTRLCKKCNTTKLSRYNDDDTCGACQLAGIEDAKAQVISMLSNSTIKA